MKSIKYWSSVRTGKQIKRYEKQANIKIIQNIKSDNQAKQK